MTSAPADSDHDLLAGNEANFASFYLWFSSMFKTTDECVDELYRRLLEAGIELRCCSVPIHARKSGQRTVQCRSCFTKTSITASTFFHRIKRVRAWLALILLKQEGIIVNPFQFHKHFDVAYATAANMFRKLRSMFEQTMELDCPIVPSSSFASLISRRSRETPATQHPVSELNAQYACEEPADISGLDSVKDSVELSETEHQVYDCLSTTEKIHFNQLCRLTGLETSTLSATLVMLELYGLVEQKFGDYFLKTKPRQINEVKLDNNLSSRVNFAATFIRNVFQGVSLRYLQHYLAECWYHANQNILEPCFLFKHCFKANTLSHKELLSYVSPQNVRVA